MTTDQLPPVHESWLPKEHSLYRPRHSSRQRTALVSALVFFCVPVLLLAVGVRPEAFENRRLVDFPSLGDGWGFLTGLDRWATDHLPLRAQAVDANNGISRGVFGEAPQLNQKHDLGPVPAPVPPKDPSLDKPDPTAYAPVIEGKDGWLYLGVDVRAACQPKIELDETFRRLNRLRHAVESTGRRFVLTIAPNKSTVVPEYLPAKYFGKDCASAKRDEFWRRVSAETGAVDLRPGLKAEAERVRQPVYSKTDSHWNYTGGLVMVRAIVERIQPGVTASWRTEQSRTVDVPADLPLLFGRSERLTLQEYRISPDGTTPREQTVPLPEVEPHRITQPGGTGMVTPKVGMLADSFTFYLAHHMVSPFADITLQHVDAVYRDAGKVGRMLADQDVVVLEAAERNLVGGYYPLLEPALIDAIASELAKKPR